MNDGERAQKGKAQRATFFHWYPGTTVGGVMMSSDLLSSLTNELLVPVSSCSNSSQARGCKSSNRLNIYRFSEWRYAVHKVLCWTRIAHHAQHAFSVMIQTTHLPATTPKNCTDKNRIFWRTGNYFNCYNVTDWRSGSSSSSTVLRHIVNRRRVSLSHALPLSASSLIIISSGGSAVSRSVAEPRSDGRYYHI